MMRQIRIAGRLILALVAVLVFCENSFAMDECSMKIVSPSGKYDFQVFASGELPITVTFNHPYACEPYLSEGSNLGSLGYSAYFVYYIYDPSTKKWITDDPITDGSCFSFKENCSSHTYNKKFDNLGDHALVYYFDVVITCYAKATDSCPGGYIVDGVSYRGGGVSGSHSALFDTALTVNPRTFRLLTSNAEPADAGSVGKSPDKTQYDLNEKVVLTAIPADGYQFDYWGGDASGTEASIEVTMSGDKSVTAYFKAANFTVSAGDLNPQKTLSVVRPGTGPVRVAHLRLTNNAGSQADATVDSLTFTFDGNGSAADITAVELYRDSGCSGSETLLKSGGLAGSAITFSGMTETVQYNVPMCYFLKYKFNKPTPCADYGAKIEAGGVSARIDSEEVQVTGSASGGVNIDYPELTAEGNTDISTSVNKELKVPLIIKISDLKPGDISGWAAEFSISTSPDGATGHQLENGQSENKVPFDSMGAAWSGFRTGSKTGLYTVTVGPVKSETNLYTCRGYSSLSSYDIFAAGVDLVAQNDGNTEDDYVGTFISGISAPNRLTATINVPPGDTSLKIKKVLFTIDGKTQEDATEPYEIIYDMSKLTAASTILLTAVAEDGGQFEQEYPFSAINIPEWAKTIQKIAPKLAWEYMDEEDNTQDRYHLSVTYPDDFTWKKLIPVDIPIIGGQENDAEASLTLEADYYIKETTAFTGTGLIDAVIIGHPFSAKGTVNAEFDKYFGLKKATGTIEASTRFDLPEKSMSRTFVVYGVPVTVAVDLGGNVKVFVNGAIVFDDKLQLEKATIVPGTTLTLDITASASAAFGFAKLGVQSSPAATLKIKIGYTTGGGVRSEAFGGELEVPVTVIGSLFWGLTEGELASDTFGPYTFGDTIEASSPYKPHKLRKAVTNGKKYYSTSATAADSQGRKIIIWTKDTASVESGPNPEIAYRIDTGSGWGADSLMTSNQKWELDPRVTFLSNGSALSVWTSNKGDQTLNNLNQILGQQDIAYSYYDGTSWSSEGPITDDSLADGSADLAYDSQAGKAMAVWVHNTKAASGDTFDKGGWSIYHSLFDPAAKTWTTPAAITGTNDTAADYMPAIISNSQGKYVAVWVKDLDGKLFREKDKVAGGTNVDNSNSDNHLYYSVYNGATWGTPGKITRTDNQTKQMPDLALAADGRIAAVWVQKDGTTDKMYLSLYNISADTWSVPEVADTGDYLIEDPQISVDSSNKAVLVYRKHDGKEDAVYTITKDLSGTSQAPQKAGAAGWAEPKRLTHDNTTDLWLSAAAGPDGKIVLSSTGLGGTASTGETVKAAVVDTIQKAALTGQNTETAVTASSGKYEHLRATIGVNVTTAGKYALKAGLYTAEGAVISEGASQTQELQAGAHDITLDFSGRKISASKADGPYTIKNIILLDASSAMSIAVDSDATGLQTAGYTHDQFIEPRITTDKDIYIGEDDAIHITVTDENATGTITVQVISSAIATPLTVALTETSPGVFEGSVKLSAGQGADDTIQTEDAGVLQINYTDQGGQDWQTALIWKTSKPRIAASPASYDFGNVSAGQTSDPVSLTVTNNGDSDLLISSASLTGKDSGEFTIQTDDCSAKTIKPEGTCTIAVAMKPNTGGTKSAELTIASDDTDNPSLKMALTGKSAEIYTLTANISGSGSVTAKGLTCISSVCTGQYEKKGGKDLKVAIRATPSSGYAFSSWGGGCSGTVPKCTLALNSDQAVTVTFSELTPEISVTPDTLTLDFGNIRTNRKSIKAVIISNNGTGLLNMTMSLDGDPDFTLSGKTTVTVKPGKKYNAKVVFKPTTAETKTATLAIMSDDTDEQTISVTLNGTGTAKTAQADKDYVTRAEAAERIIAFSEAEGTVPDLPAAAVESGLSPVNDYYCKAGPPFADVTPDKPYCKYIKKLQELGIITGCPDGAFWPEGFVTRAEAAEMIIAFSIQLSAFSETDGTVPDLPAVAVESGLSPVNDDYCKAGPPFADVAPDKPYCKYIKKLQELGIITGHPDGAFRPEGFVTREEMEDMLELLTR